MLFRRILIASFILSLLIVSCSVVTGKTQVKTPTVFLPSGEQTPGLVEKNEPINEQNPENTVVDQPTDLDLSITPSPEEGEPHEETECMRPYTDNSIWNVPIDWSKAQIHPDSDGMMAAFFESDQWIGTNTDSYAPNIYFVTNETPLVLVQLRKYSFRDAIDDQGIVYGEPGGVVWMPLPEEARPAPGTDGQLAVINLDTGEEWGLGNGEIGFTGQWYAGGAYRYHIENSGVPPEGFAMRGAGIGQVAGIIRPCEVARGFIGHAVTIAYDFPCAPDVCEANGWPAVIPPFTKTDGLGKLSMDIPEGARMVVRPEITHEEITKACHGLEGCIAWIVNMQKYGGFIVDNSGHPKTYGEGSNTANWDPDIWTNKMLQDIPMEWYAILDWNVDATALP